MSRRTSARAEAGRATDCPADPVHHRRRVFRTAQPASRFRRHVRGDRPAGPVAGYAPVAGQSAARRGPAARTGSAPVVSDMPERRCPPANHEPFWEHSTHINCRTRPARVSCALATGELIRFQAAFVSGPLQGGRARVGAGATDRAAVHLTKHGASRAPAGGRRARTQRSAGGPGPSVRARTAARTKSGCRRWTQHRHCDALLRRSRTRAGRPDRAHRHRRPPVRAVPNTADGRVVRSRRQCRGRRCASNGQVDGAAHADHGAGGDPRSGTGAVLLPGLRRRSAGLARYAHCRMWVRSPAGPSRSWSSA